MLTGLELMSCPNQAVPAEVMHHIVHVESGYNPFAIGVVGGQLVRQPQSLDEAIATAQMLEIKGYNYSLGVSQVNRSNLAKYGLDTYAKAFNPCLNLSAGSRILNECYYSSGGDWGKAFSCYYSGDFVTGFRQGYVQKVFASMSQNAQPDSSDAVPIPLQVSPTTSARAVCRHCQRHTCTHRATGQRGVSRIPSKHQRVGRGCRAAGGCHHRGSRQRVRSESCRVSRTGDEPSVAPPNFCAKLGHLRAQGQLCGRSAEIDSKRQ
jgi:hypothetical protein